MALFVAHLYGGNDLLAVGSTAPLFSLASSNCDTVKFLDFREKKNVVLVFYPGDQTPGCTKQLCALRDDYTEFDKKDAVIFGVNPADVQSHKKFIEKQHYQFPLLVDDGKTLIGQIKRRCIKSETIPHEEKIFSLFERYTEWIVKGSCR